MFLDLVISDFNTTVPTIMSVISTLLLVYFAIIKRIFKESKLKNQINNNSEGIDVIRNEMGEEFLRVDKEFIVQKNNYTKQFDEAKVSRNQIRHIVGDTKDKINGVDKKVAVMDQRLINMEGNISEIKESLKK